MNWPAPTGASAEETGSSVSVHVSDVSCSRALTRKGRDAIAPAASARAVSDIRGLPLTERRELLGDVDADGAPGDAAAAADAARRAELVDPRGELVRQPLPVPGAPGRPDAAAVDVRVVEREARVPHPGALGVEAGEVGRVLDRGAEARRTDERAVGTAEAARRDVLPVRVLEVFEQDLPQAVGLEAAAHPSARRVDRHPGGREVVLGRRAPRQPAQKLEAALAPRLDEEPVLTVEELRQREVD